MRLPVVLTPQETMAASVQTSRMIGRLAFAAALLCSLGCGRNVSPVQPTPLQPVSTIDGTYALRLESTCAALPAELRIRNYTATISGSPDVTVTLAGAQFWTHPTHGLLNRFSGRLTGNSLAVDVRWPPTFLNWGIVETIDSTRFFEVIGQGSGLITGTTIVGSMSVGVGVGTDLRDELLHTGCSAFQHSVTFRFSKQL